MPAQWYNIVPDLPEPDLQDLATITTVGHQYRSCTRSDETLLFQGWRFTFLQTQRLMIC